MAEDFNCWQFETLLANFRLEAIRCQDIELLSIASIIQDIGRPQHFENSERVTEDTFTEEPG